jgi:hypothetical protein
MALRAACGRMGGTGTLKTADGVDWDDRGPEKRRDWAAGQGDGGNKNRTRRAGEEKEMQH